MIVLNSASKIALFSLLMAMASSCMQEGSTIEKFSPTSHNASSSDNQNSGPVIIIDSLTELSSANIPSPIKRSQFKKIVVFGDSLSDNGNTLERTKGLMPSDPYWEGHFSNGPTWPDYLARYLKITVDNRAYGGSRTSDRVDKFSDTLTDALHGFGKATLAGNLISTFQDYRSEVYSLRPALKENLYIVFSGGNNFLDYALYELSDKEVLGAPESINMIIDWSLEDVSSVIMGLYDLGARTIIIPTLPEYVPSFTKDPTAKTFFKLTQLFNSAWPARIDEIKRRINTAHPNDPLQLMIFDFAKSYSYIATNPSKFGLLPDVQNYCYVGGSYFGDGSGTLCKNPQERLSFDDVHPSSMTHCWLSYSFVEAFFPETITSKQDYKQMCLYPYL